MELRSVQDKVCNFTLIVLALFAIPALIASLARIPTIGWKWDMGLHVVFVSLLWILLLFRNSTSYHLRAGYLIFMLTAVGLAGLSTLGMISGAIPFLSITPTLVVIFFRFRMAILYIVITFALATWIAYAFVNGQIVGKIDILAVSVNPLQWLTFLLALLAAFATPVGANMMVNTHLSNALSQAQQNKRDLERQVLERTKELEKLSITDKLTGLFNRMKLDNTLHHEIKRAKRYHSKFSVILFDIDHFKTVNDKYGHMVGDQVLQHIAKILQENVREADTVGRWGGEEFLIITLENDIESAVILAEKLRYVISEYSFPNVGQKTCSFGVATWRPQEREEELLSRADDALYRAKTEGRNRVIAAKQTV